MNEREQVVLFQPHPKQEYFIEQVFNPAYKFIAYGGAAGGGKTFSSLGTLILLCKLYPKSRWCVLRKSNTEIDLNTMPSFWKVCPKNFVKKATQKPHEVIFKNESSIIFRGENLDQDPDLQWMDGLEVNGFLLEQAEELSYKTFDKCKLRAGRHIVPSNPPIKILLTLNPAQMWTKTVIYEPYTKGELKPPYIYIPAKMPDNPSLPQDYIDGMKDLDEYTRRRFVDGDWDAVKKTGQECFHSFDYSKHVKEVYFDPDINIHITYDFNVVPYMTLLCAQIVMGDDDRWKVRFYQEFCLGNPKNSTLGVTTSFKDTLTDYYGRVFFYGDYSGKNRNTLGMEDIISNYSIVEQQLAPWIDNASDRVIPNQSVNKRIRFINAIFEGRLPIDIEISPSCEKLIADISYILQSADGSKYKQKIKDPATKVSYEKWGHPSDAMEYLITSAFRNLFDSFK